jgi:hypothetical protein
MVDEIYVAYFTAKSQTEENKHSSYMATPDAKIGTQLCLRYKAGALPLDYTGRY